MRKYDFSPNIFSEINNRNIILIVPEHLSLPSDITNDSPSNNQSIQIQYIKPNVERLTAILVNDITYEFDNYILTAKIIASPKAKGKVFIPRIIKNKKIQYEITTIGERSFEMNKTISSLTFDPKSEVTTIENNAFKRSSISKLQIPQKFEYFASNWNCCMPLLSEIEISPKNNNFILENGFLLDKEKETIYFYLRDLETEELIIPSTIIYSKLCI
ncbi:hypothetical protein TRFO_09392 [Tritrichomonas foetus]|uniref:Uncharacterized protein n=1 Tax=Tritrichomonas foetus TaxID=1144522 RepID=A0A1J4JGI7_9EUKA|nr:hypothetical protein TRFO_09392 [Tritrichomonas foetus]|eukprot:OHS97415.1 hypothetical protein TRFO_09392 [Tritrichomonas foetus]